MSRYTADGRRRSSMAHAQHPNWCSCGRTIYGNGAAAHLKANPDHRWLTFSQWQEREVPHD